MHSVSLTRRLLTVVIVAELALAAGLTILGVSYMRSQLRSAFDADLNGRAISVAALVRYPEDGQTGLVFTPEMVPPASDRAHPDLYEVRASTNAVIARSTEWPASLADMPAQGEWEFTFLGVRYRGLVIRNLPVMDTEEGAPRPAPTLNIVYASPLLQVHRRVLQVGIFLGTAALFLLACTIALASWGIRRGLVPLRELAARATGVSSQNWNFDVPRSAVLIVELRPLVAAIQRMLAGLHESFTHQRQFLADAAHELKTPVTILKSSMQMLVQRPRSAAEYQSGIEHSLEDVGRLEDLLQRMLRLARVDQWTDGVIKRQLGAVDVTSTCESAVVRLAQLAQSHGVHVELVPHQSPTVRADADDLELVWVNLLENAIQHSPAGSAVRVEVSGNNGTARVLVSDQGEGIAVDELPHIFERFRRGKAASVRDRGGFGLGLAIAKRVVDAYGGSIDADSAPGQGTRITVQIPSNGQ